jgi:predicted MPP superfamily phosphohydrolase
VARRILYVVLFLIVLVTVLGGSHYYLASRLVFALHLPPAIEAALTAVLVALGISPVLYFVGERFLKPPFVRFLSWPAALWIGAGFLLLVLCAGSDLLLLVLGAFTEAEFGVERAIAVTSIGAVATALSIPNAMRTPRVKRVEIALARWPAALDGYRIVQITDIHIGPILGRSFARAVTERVNSLDADLVAVTGDLVDGTVSMLRSEVAPFGALRGRDGVYFVTGNHDYYSGADTWAAYLASLGLRPLRNEHVTIARRDGSFDLAGVEDAHASQVDPRRREDVRAALAGRDAERPVVLLAHDPSTFKRASRHAVDLQISGHTHGGQIWPFVYAVRAVIPWVAGIYRKGPSALYVSRGTGFWGPPMRFAAPSEITEIVLRAGGPRAATETD